ncbi:MAG: hypothetical protein WKH64_05410 [Chloroflexia bacterium]
MPIDRLEEQREPALEQVGGLGDVRRRRRAEELGEDLDEGVAAAGLLQPLEVQGEVEKSTMRSSWLNDSLEYSRAVVAFPLPRGGSAIVHGGPVSQDDLTFDMFAHQLVLRSANHPALQRPGSSRCCASSSSI